MNRPIVPAVLLSLFVCLGIGYVAFGNGALASEEEPAIMVSPQMVVLAKVSSITIHSNIPANSVAADSVTVNGVEPAEIWADDCGHLAVRVGVADIGLVAGPAVITLQGAYDDGGTFSASDAITVK